MPITKQEAAKLLALAAAYDRRTIGAADVEAWNDAAARGRWTFDGAAEAIKDHYAMYSPSDRWLSPGDITQYFKRDVRQPAPIENHKRGQLEPGPGSSPEHRARVMAQFREFMEKRTIPKDGAA